jgi:prepilin-type N-terminal cleavage/methylation domain-containing protein
MAPATTFIILGGSSRFGAGARRRRFRACKGLTLVEMVVVIGVVLVLAGIVVSLTRHVDSQSKERTLSNTFAVLKSALQEYYEFMDAFPIQADLTTGVTTRAITLYGQLDFVPASRQVLQQIDRSFIQGDTPNVFRVCDPWGTAIDYRYKDGDTFPELISAGPDKTFGTPDDISSRNM